jgi:hypothetical protein
MGVPLQDSLPDLADKPASDPLEPERTDLANGARAGVQRGWLTGAAIAGCFRGLSRSRHRTDRAIT